MLKLTVVRTLELNAGWPHLRPSGENEQSFCPQITQNGLSNLCNLWIANGGSYFGPEISVFNSDERRLSTDVRNSSGVVGRPCTP